MVAIPYTHVQYATEYQELNAIDWVFTRLEYSDTDERRGVVRYYWRKIGEPETYSLVPARAHVIDAPLLTNRVVVFEDDEEAGAA